MVAPARNPYLSPMLPWPGLADFSRRVPLADSLTLHIYDSGVSEKPALVLLHGLGDDADTWRYLFAPLTAHFRVIAPDWPGFARSDPAPGAYRMPFFIDFLVQLMDALQMDKASLVGHSFGALAAQATSLEHPARIERLVLLSGHLGAQPKAINRQLLTTLLPVLGEWQYNHLRTDPRLAYASLRPFFADVEHLPQAERDFLFERVNQRVWSDTQRVAYFSTLRNLAGWLMQQQGHMHTTLTTATIPTLVLWGGRDAINPLGENASIIEALPLNSFVVLPEAGHNLHNEHPSAVLDRLLPFLKAE